MRKLIKNKILKYTQRKIILLISSLSLIGLTAFIFFYIYGNVSFKNLKTIEKEEHYNILQNITNFKSDNLKTYTKDYTYWDEMVTFTSIPDKEWGRVNIDQSLNTYDVDVVWVFDKTSDLIYFTKGVVTQHINPKIITCDSILKNKDNQNFNRFFVKTDSLLIEIYSASIHPSTDPQRKTHPFGYYAAGRIWNQNYLNQISQLTGTKLYVSNEYNDTLLPSQDFVVVNTIDLKDNIGNTISYLHSVNEFTNLKSIYQIAYNIFFIFLILILILISLTGFSLYFLVNKPLKLISNSLITGDENLTSKLINKENEFGHLARLI